MEKFEQLANLWREEPRRWLVTGAAGFIGSHLVEKLLLWGQSVVGVDNFVTGHRRNVELFAKDTRWAKNYEFVEGDICDAKICNKLTKNIHFVLHQAAIGSVPRSIDDPIASHAANVDGFLQILKSSLDNQVQKFVFASSSSVYGDHPKLPKTEDEIGAPLSPYAATKFIDEVYAQVFKKVYGMPVVGLRYFNVFGPRQDPKGPYAAVIPLWIDSMVNENPIFINGDGSYSRDFCYVDNVVQANFLAAASNETCNGQVYNVAYGGRTTLLQLHQMIRESLQTIDPQLEIKDPEHRDFRKGDIPHSLADITRARLQLGYEPKAQVKEGLLKTVQFFYNQHHKEKR